MYYINQVQPQLNFLLVLSRVVVGVVFISWRDRLLPDSLTEPDRRTATDFEEQIEGL